MPSETEEKKDIDVDTIAMEGPDGEKDTAAEDEVAKPDDVGNFDNVVERNAVNDAGVASEVDSVGALAVNPLEPEYSVSDGRFDVGTSSDVAVGWSD